MTLSSTGCYHSPHPLLQPHHFKVMEMFLGINSLNLVQLGASVIIFVIGSLFVNDIACKQFARLKFSTVTLLPALGFWPCAALHSPVMCTGVMWEIYCVLQLQDE